MSSKQGIHKCSLMLRNKDGCQMHSIYTYYCWAQGLLAYLLFTVFSCIKKIVESYEYVGPFCSSTFLVLILHRQLGNYTHAYVQTHTAQKRCLDILTETAFISWNKKRLSINNHLTDLKCDLCKQLVWCCCHCWQNSIDITAPLSASASLCNCCIGWNKKRWCRHMSHQN